MAKQDLISKVLEEIQKVSNQTAAAATAVKNEAKKQTSGGTGTTTKKTSEKSAVPKKANEKPETQKEPDKKPTVEASKPQVQLPTLTQRQGGFGSPGQMIGAVTKAPPAATPTASRDAKRRENFAKNHPEMTGGMEGARTRAANTANITPTALTYQERQLTRAATMTPAERERLGIEQQWYNAKDAVKTSQAEVDRLQKERETTRQQWAGLSRAGNAGDLQRATKDRLDALDASLTASKEALKKAESDLGYWSLARYEDRSQRTQQALSEDPAATRQYADAKKVIADQQKLYELINYRQAGGGGAPEDAARFTQMEEELVRDYGLAPDAVSAYVGGYGTPYSEGLSVQQIMERMDSALAERKTALKEGSDRAAGYDFDDLYGYEQRVEALKHREEVIGNARKAADEHPVGQTLGSVILQPFRVADVFTISSGRGDPGDPDYIPPYNRAGIGDIVDTTRGTVAEGIKNKVGDNFWGNTLSFLYSVGMSTVDSAATVAVMGPHSVYLMGTTAGISNARDIIDRGGTIDQAVAGGVAAGAAEIFFEKFSVDNLLKPRTVSGWRSWVKETLKQGGVEASEEMATEIANILSDAAIMGQKSEFNQSVQAYMDKENMSKEEAERRAFLDCVGQVALAGAGGFISGALMGGSVQGYNLHQYNQQSAALGRDFRSMGPEVGQYRLNKPYNVDKPTVPIINLSTQDIPTQGGELPAVGNSLRSDAITRARDRLGLNEHSAAYIPASNVMRDGNEYVLKITKASLNKMLSPADGGTVPLESIVVLDNIERIANNGVWFNGQGDRRGRQQIAGIDHLKTTVYIDGAPYLVDMRARLIEEVQGKGVDNVLYYFTPEEIITIERVGTESPTDERRALIGGSEIMPTLNPSIPQTAQDVNLKGRSLGDRVADATKRTLEEMARTEKKARFLKESKPLRDRLAQVQAESKAAMAQIEDRYGRAVADREPGTIQVKDGETAEQSKTELTKGEDGSTIGEQKGKKITAITDGAISRVPRVEVPGWTAEQCATVQQQHQELLRYARAKNQGKEVAFVFRPGDAEPKVFLGTDDSLDFGSSLYGTGLVVMHNHPGNHSFSDQDITFFLGHDGVRCLTIVRHDGGVELLIKTDEYSRKKALTELNRSFNEYAKGKNDKQITKAIFEFLKRGKGGFKWIKIDGGN